MRDLPQNFAVLPQVVYARDCTRACSYIILFALFMYAFLGGHQAVIWADAPRTVLASHTTVHGWAALKLL